MESRLYLEESIKQLVPEERYLLHFSLYPQGPSISSEFLKAISSEEVDPVLAHVMRQLGRDKYLELGFAAAAESLAKSYMLMRPTAAVFPNMTPALARACVAFGWIAEAEGESDAIVISQAIDVVSCAKGDRTMPEETPSIDNPEPLLALRQYLCQRAMANVIPPQEKATW